MSPKLRPLLLPQLVERRKIDGQYHAPLASPGAGAVELSHVYYTAKSSSSDVTSPVTPTFSPRGHQRFSSSTSSLELPPQPPSQPPAQDCGPASPAGLYGSAKAEKRQLPDVQEDPMERWEEESNPASEHFGLYSCLCDEPCQHRNSSEGLFSPEIAADFDIDYDIGCLSDGDFSDDPRHARKKGGNGSPFSGLTSRLGSRLPAIRRWRSGRHAKASGFPFPDVSQENMLSRESSSCSSSASAANQPTLDRFSETVQTCRMTSASTISYYDSAEDLSRSSMAEMTAEEQSSLERDRSLATTPLLPPLLTGPLSKPPQESPLQSPNVEPSPPAMAVTSGLQSAAAPPPPLYPRPSLSSRPSMTSLRQAPTATDMALPLPPAMLQEHDRWSARLGHANFTITPMPYELASISSETVSKFQDDWDMARINYTKHLVRTGEHYGQTSKIYALTEAKWAETERRWRGIYDDILRQKSRSAPGSASHSRSHSRGRGRGRSNSSVGMASRLHSQEYVLAGLAWRRMDDCLPSAVPRMDAQGKFPYRGDEDIVGPMQRDAVMVRARSEDAKGHFWRSLADKVGFRK